MYKYRLTRRGKVVAALFIIALFSASGMLSMGVMARAQNSEPYKDSLTSEGFETKYLIKAGIFEEKPDDMNNRENLNIEGASVEDSYESEVNSRDISAGYLYMDSDLQNIVNIDAEKAFALQGRKIAFLTFDDGPSKNVTPQVLDILKKYEVKATFFVLGSLSARNSTIIKQISDCGHAIGIHTYSHNYKAIYKSAESFTNEVNMTDAVLKKILGKEFHTRLFRFPGGSFEDYKKQYKDILTADGYISVDWNVVNGDGESSNLTPQKLIDRVKATSSGKHNIIVLMHDSSNKQTTVDALPGVIEYLRSEGYEFAALK